MFTFSFGSTIAWASTTYDASQVAAAYAQEEAKQLTYLAETKARVCDLYTFDTDGYVTSGSCEGLTKETLAIAAQYIIDEAEKAMTAVVNSAVAQSNVDDGTAINVSAIGDATLADGVTTASDKKVSDLTVATKMKTAIEESKKALELAYDAQEQISKTFFTDKINSVDITKYSNEKKGYAESIGSGTFLEGSAEKQTGTKLTTAEYIEYLEATAIDEINAKAATNETNTVKAKAYRTIAKYFDTLVKTIPTAADEAYNDTTDTGVANAVAIYLAYGKSEVYGSYKLEKAEDGYYTGNFDTLDNYDNIYKAKTSYSKATLFGVEIADVTKITQAEATAVNNAFYKAIVDSADVVKAYADDADDVEGLYMKDKVMSVTITAWISEADLKAQYGNGQLVLYKDQTLTESALTTGKWGSYNGNAYGPGTYYYKTQGVDKAAYMATLDRTVKAVDLYADVVELGDAYKAKTEYGVKIYDDANVDKAVAKAKELVYKDLGSAFKTAEQYIALAATDLDITLTQVNYEKDKFEKAISDAIAKMWDGNSPAKAVTYGADKTSEADLVYLKGTYASSEADEWTAIAEDAAYKIGNAESYADIETALADAATDFGKLLTVKDSTAVTTARTNYKTALANFVTAQKAIKGLVNYAGATYTAAQTDGDALIDDANTVANVEAAYKNAQDIVTGIKTNDELKAMKEALATQISALPKTSVITVSDKAAIIAAFDAYKTYVDTPGASDALVNKTALKDALAKVYELEGKELQAKVDEAEKAIDKLSNGNTPVSDSANAELAAKKAEYKALCDEAEAFNKEVANDDENGVNDYFDSLVTGVDYTDLQAAVNPNGAVWNGEVGQVKVALVAATKAGASVADMKAALDAYNKLTDRQKYSVDKNVYDAVKRVEANIVEAVEALKIKASSTAKKGSITVKWTASGDAAAADGYEIWKSTKVNKGFKKAFTTTKTSYKNTKDLKKGTRYYYKVRAYKMVDGVKVTSDWSNKAYNKAK